LFEILILEVPGCSPGLTDMIVDWIDKLSCCLK
jgi:hypothetical protein